MKIHCNHVICKREDNIWFPTNFINRTDLEIHPWCLECGDIKNISNDRPKSLGHWMNILGSISHELDLTQCQTRLIAKELESSRYLCDTFGTFGSSQRDVFISIVSKHCDIKGLNLDFRS